MTHISDRWTWSGGAPVGRAAVTTMTRPATALPMVERTPVEFVGHARPAAFLPTPATAPVTLRSGGTLRDAHYCRGFNISALAGAQTIAQRLDHAQHSATSANPSSEDMQASSVVEQRP
jgi:hypothetical protein